MRCRIVKRGQGGTAACVQALAGLACFVIAQLGSGAAAFETSDDLAGASFDWSGWYVGARAGYGLGSSHATLTDPSAARAKSALQTLLGGADLGYRHRFHSGLVLGLETGLSFPNFFPGDDASAVFQTSGGDLTLRLDMLGEVRGTAGYALDPLLIYAAGGFSWSLQHFAQTSGLSSAEDDAWSLTPGWTLGAGVEVAVARDWGVRLEYLHDELAPATATLPSGSSGTSRQGVDQLLLGLNHRLRLPGDRSPDASGATSSWNLHGQATFIEQGYPAFHSPYSGVNSLSGAAQANDTASATLFFGTRLWRGAELYLNPELMQGFGLSLVHGVAAFPNGEAQKAGFLVPRFNIARLFVTQTLGFGGARELLADAPNQIAGERAVSRLSITVGKMAVTDFFTVNAYAGDSRTSFLNWNVFGGGSYDLTMDQLSWTWGALVELNQSHWALRAGYFLVPIVSNSDTFDTDIPNHGEYVAELELRYAPYSKLGKLRLFGWVNRGNLGSYAAALAEATGTAGYPDITSTRETRDNYGVVVGAEQAITADLGLFSRVSWSPGQVEILGWTDCDQSLSLGGTLKGAAWHRPQDTIGLGAVVEGLSTVAARYFAAGGLGILIGDGRINYRPEAALETYYAYSPLGWLTATLDYQLIVDPGYNADRGPVSVFSLRLHAGL